MAGASVAVCLPPPRSRTQCSVVGSTKPRPLQVTVLNPHLSRQSIVVVSGLSGKPQQAPDQSTCEMVPAARQRPPVSPQTRRNTTPELNSAVCEPFDPGF